MNLILQKEFGFQVNEIKKLHAYENLNYLIKTNQAKYVFKTYPYTKDLLGLVEAENETLLFLQKSDKNSFPKPIPFKDGSLVKVLMIENEKSICRMLSYLEGELLGDVAPSNELFQSFGIFLAEMNLKLHTFDNDTIRNKVWDWGIQFMHFNKKYIADIEDAKNRKILYTFFQEFEENIAPKLSDLRKSIIHNDANDLNVLVNKGVISGIIDFGDLAYSPLINELAVAIAYACYETEDPLKWALIIFESYQSKIAIEEKEISVLYYLIVARLAISVSNAAYFKRINPDNTYTSIGEKSAWKLIHKWLNIGPISAEKQFRNAVSGS